jgi:hypothetical protein
MKLINVIKICLTCLTFAVLCGVAQAQPVNLLGNPGFELPDQGKYTNFDNGPTTYWNDDGVTYVNTGVENFGAHSGTYRAWEMMTDDGAYQISTNPVPLKLGDQVILTWWAAGTTTTDPELTNPADPMQIVGIITATNANVVQNDPFLNTTAVLVTSNALPSGWMQYSLIYTAQASDTNKYPGVFFNTGELGGVNTTNCFAAYDDFAMYVQPAGSPPIILIEPVSQTAALLGSASFTVSALNATSYQWKGGTPGSGVYTNLVNNPPYVSGVTTTNLTFTQVTTNQNMDIVVVVSNGSSVTSAPPANLTVAGLVYAESFYMPTKPDQTVNHVGWMNDATGTYFNRIFSNNHGVTFPVCAVYSYNGAGATEAFYGTVTTITGGPYAASPPITNRMAFPGINLNIAQNVAFSVAMNQPAASQPGFICVQMNFGPWYVSTNGMQATGGLTFVTNSYKFNPAMSGWKDLTVSGVGSDSANLVPVIGGVATNDLTGYITGIGLVVTHSGGTTLQFNNYSIVAAIPPSPCPIISSPPFSTTNYTGTTATFNVAANSNGVSSVLSYQWQTNTAVGSTNWASVGNGSKFSGVTTATLSVSNVSAATDHKDFRVIVWDAVCTNTSGLPNGPEAILTVVDSVPFVVNSTMIYPNDALGFGSTTVYTNEAGNNNTLHMTATFNGTQPVKYHWQIASDTNGTGAVDIPGATNVTYTLSNPQVSDSGYYGLQASNSISGVTNTLSGWVQLAILSSTNALIHWSAPVAISGLTKAQILGLPGTYLDAELFNGAAVNGGTNVTVTNGITIFTFDNTGASATIANVTRALTGQYSGLSTGDTNLDLVLNTGDEVYSGAFNLTLSNLTVGQLYSVQIFGLNNNTGPTRQGNFSVPTDFNDVSASFMFGDDVYVVGTFIATAAYQQISMGQAGGGGYLSSVIVRSTAPPSPTIQKSGSNLQVSWSMGTLLQATNLTGPWLTNTGTSPITITPAAPRQFFRTRVP